MNAKDRMPGCVEISMGCWEVVFFSWHTVCVCARVRVLVFVCAHNDCD